MAVEKLKYLLKYFGREDWKFINLKLHEIVPVKERKIRPPKKESLKAILLHIYMCK